MTDRTLPQVDNKIEVRREPVRSFFMSLGGFGYWGRQRSRKDSDGM
jgi:hypothetical protein